MIAINTSFICLTVFWYSVLYIVVTQILPQNMAEYDVEFCAVLDKLIIIEAWCEMEETAWDLHIFCSFKSR